MVSNIFLKYLFLKEKSFALGLKASRVLAMSTFLFSFYSFSFSIFWWFHSCSGWHWSIDLLVLQSRSAFFIQFFEFYFRTCTAMFFFKCSVSSVCCVRVCVCRVCWVCVSPELACPLCEYVEYLCVCVCVFCLCICCSRDCSVYCFWCVCVM